MGLLLRDDVFVDFFNTFLNLPVFGQTPIYISSTGQWNLWPELPSHVDPSPPALLAWLEKHRLPHFCKSSLFLHLVLCQKLLGFIRSEEAGEELTNFWLTTERLLELDESDERQRELYLSLLHRLKATHLREGSSVITLCRTITGSLLKARHIQSISTRREILSKMQEQVLFMIQSYWLPKFFIHCKMGIKEEKLCWPLLQEYQERLLWASSEEPSGFSENLFMMHIRKSQGLSGPYCSKKAKVEIWALIRELPSLEKPIKTLGFLPWALSAETCAGWPFRDFLKCQDRPMETLLLDLWHDLEEFLSAVLDPSRENSFFLRHLTGEKICKTYLEEGTIQQLPLETRTLRRLRNHLMSGEFSPWVFRAQEEICKVLYCFYEEFLAYDDRMFLQFMSPQSNVPMPEMQDHAVGKEECFLLSQRINESLKLSQALDGTRNLEGLSSKHWQLLGTRDLRNGGSIQAEVETLLCNTMPLLPCYIVGPSQITAQSDHLQFFKQLLEEHNADKPLSFWMAVKKLPLSHLIMHLAACNMQSEKEVTSLKRKVAIISKLFLNSDILPKFWR
ncbi:PREDICTED: regulator of G-protein signaling protein-like [Nestor notabilis]|uniref:regulator of G-protein signaling protein-like n=1 Tax=Nestor notabilis TaxID=176057 RepID=UPI00052344CB|nr:PREDICTED: regulator of G-protein signaling protein-like [Nestor notabilis]